MSFAQILGVSPGIHPRIDQPLSPDYVFVLVVLPSTEGFAGGLPIHDFSIVFLIRRASSVGRERRQKVELTPHQLHLISDSFPTALGNSGRPGSDEVCTRLCVDQRFGALL
jgi:hypothetical protein